jgi:hypothetical protein
MPLKWFIRHSGEKHFADVSMRHFHKQKAQGLPGTSAFKQRQSPLGDSKAVKGIAN